MDTIVATFDINKLVAGTQEHLIYHQKRRYAEQKASGKINAPPKTKESKKQRKEYNDRSRLTGVFFYRDVSPSKIGISAPY
jgi:hypothetical protein